MRLSGRLTLNLGLRYEATTIPYDRRGLGGEVNSLTAPVGSATCPLTIQPTTVPGCTVPISQFLQSNPTLNDFEPRVGFAWNPFGNGKTAVRGAFGIYDELPLPYILTTYSSNLGALFERRAAGRECASGYVSVWCSGGGRGELRAPGWAGIMSRTRAGTTR